MRGLRSRTAESRNHRGNRHPGHRRQGLFLLVVFLLLAVGISVAGYFYYRKIAEDVEREAEHSLIAISNLKVTQIVAWRKERLGDAQVIADNLLLRDDLEEWSQDPRPGSRQDGILLWMRSLIEAYGYSAVMWFDKEARLALSLPEQRDLIEETDRDLVRQAIRERQIIFSDLYRKEPNGNIHMDLAVPILGTAPENPPTVGALVIRLDPRTFLYPLIQNWPEPSDSAESLLVRREGGSVLFLNDLRHRPDCAFRLRLPLDRRDLPAAIAVSGYTRVVKGTDYRGVPVMAALRPVPGTPWFLVSKVDDAEVFAPLWERTFLLWVLTIVLVIACGAGLGIVSSRQAAQFYRHQDEQMAEYRRQLEQTISETNILFRKVVETLPVGLYLADRSGRIIASNPAGDQIWGAHPVGPVNSDEYRAWRVDTGKPLAPEEWAMARAIQHGQTTLDEMLEIEAFDGTRKIVLNSAVPVYDDRRELLGAFVVIQDITQRREAERRRKEQELLELEKVRILAESRREWQETFDGITDLISIHDEDFTIRKANRAFLEHFGLSPDELQQHKCHELFHGGNCPSGDCPAQDSTGCHAGVSREISDSRSGRVFLVSTFPFQSRQDEPGRFIHIAKDITEQKERELKLILSERLASLGQMAAGIAHEINNPLATIGACAEGLLRRAKEGRHDPGVAQDYLGIIEEEVRRCQSITGGMLSFVRQSHGERATLDAHELLEKTLTMIDYQGRLRDIEVVRQYSADLPRIQASEGGMRQVLLALVVNALDAMADQGTLTLSTSVGEDGRVRISVQDSGPGIPPSLMGRIFDLFFTTKSDRGGTGLGLPIAHQIVRENGGEMEVDPAPGRGATFTVVLPVS